MHSYAIDKSSRRYICRYGCVRSNSNRDAGARSLIGYRDNVRLASHCADERACNGVAVICKRCSPVDVSAGTRRPNNSRCGTGSAEVSGKPDMLESRCIVSDPGRRDRKYRWRRKNRSVYRR
jgi:hypothetical protein